MWRRGLANPSRWPGWLLFAVMAAAAVALAWASFDLARLAMANQSLIVEHGLMGLLEGGLEQAAEIAARGAAALAFYLLFKTCEAELVARWRRPPD